MREKQRLKVVAINILTYNNRYVQIPNFSPSGKTLLITKLYNH